MYNSDELVRIISINKKLESIYTIIHRHGNITKALGDEVEGQPAILMLLTASAEQFSKLKKIDAMVLNEFDKLDIKGIISVRNFIAHDYDGISLSMIENDLRYNIPKILEITNSILEKNKPEI